MKEELQAIINKLSIQKEEAEELAKKAILEAKKINLQIKKIQKLIND
jgi:hypothetical protein